MSNLVNFKKLTTKILIGIVLAGSLVTLGGTKEAVATTCGDHNNGHGNDKLYTVLPSDDAITVENFDPDNPGAKRGQLKTILMNGRTSGNGMTIAYSNGAFELTDQQAEYVINNLRGMASGSLDPDSFSDTIFVGETVTLDRTVTINCVPDVVTTETTTEDRKVDILFLADNTNSMTSAISNIQTNATTLINTLSTTYGDVEFGVAKYYGDPTERIGGDDSECVRYRRGECREWSYQLFGATGAYQLQQTIGGATIDITSAIGQWAASAPNRDWKEGNFFALHQAATNGATVNGYGTNSNTGWRTDATKVIVWFGDAYSSDSTINQANTIQALRDNGIKVVAIHVDTNTYRLNNGEYFSSVQGLNYDSQASTIATQTGGAFASSDPGQLSSTITSLVGQALTSTTTNTTTAGSIDLTFQAVGDTSGLNITYTCTDDLGCNDVGSNESRTFRMEVEGVTAGTYNFETVIVGVDGAVGDDEVTVIDVFAD